MLFTTTLKLTEYAELVSTINFASIKPTIRMVEEQHIIPVLGKEQYNNLSEAVTAASDEATLTDAQKDLLHKCRSVVGPYVCYYYAPKAEVKLSDGGLRREETNTSKSAYQYQGTNYREQNLLEGEAATELLLEFLEENKTTYTDWAGSEAFKQYRSLFIKSGKEFQQLFPSHSPYRNYWAMRAKMVDVEENNIKPAIGAAFFNDLKETDQSKTATFDEDERELMFKIKKAIAYFTVAYSIPFLNVRIDANGITVMNQGGSSKDDEAKRSGAGDTALSSLIKKCEDGGQAWLKNSLQYIIDHIGLFPLAATLVPPPVKNVENTNATCKGSFGMF